MKPLNRKAYGHIGHFPGSRMGVGDHHVHEGQARICCEKVRDKHDEIIVQEKLDGSCVAVANVAGEILALGRSGYLAQTSKYRQHQLFAEWVRRHQSLFAGFLVPGERLVGEWIAQAHGTRYDLHHEPFVVFDLMVGETRATLDALSLRLGNALPQPALLHRGKALPIPEALEKLGPYGHHGALDPVEGAVWRVERKGEVDFLAKYVRPDKQDGCYLPEKSGAPEVWNWQPGNLVGAGPDGNGP